MNLTGEIILGITMAVVLFAPRLWALMGMLGGVLYLTQGQEIQVLGFNLYAIRFLEVAGFVRVLFRRELAAITLNRLDNSLIWLYGYMVLVFLFRSTEGYAKVIGGAIDAWLCFFTFRALIQDLDDLRWLLRAFLVLLIPYVLLLLWESHTGHNPFASMGGAPGESWTRNGRIRCFGSFRQTDTLGTVGISFLPLYLGLVLDAQHRKAGVFGVVLCLAVVWATNSGGPLGGVVAGLLGWFAWGIRTRLKAARWGVLIMVGLVALLMKAPIWYLIQRASSVTGGSGWHRAYLIDVTMRHFNSWFLTGMPVENTAAWFPYKLNATNGADITNQFIAFGLTAGIGAIVLLMLVLKRAFSDVGNALHVIRSNALPRNPNEFLVWGLGVMLFVHAVNWLGISYFDQIYVIWFLQLAAISSICGGSKETVLEKIGEPMLFDVKTVAVPANTTLLKVEE